MWLSAVMKCRWFMWANHTGGGSRLSALLLLLVVISSSHVSCQELILNFDSSSSYLAYSTWDGSTSGRLEFSFRTSEPDSLLFYQDDGRVDGDFLMLSFVDGDLTLDVRMQALPEPDEDGHRTFNSSGEGTLVDGEWHSVLVERLNGSRRRIKIKIDDQTWVNFNSGDGSLDTSGLAYFGGLRPNAVKENLPMLETAALPNFKGCMKSIRYVDADGTSLNPAPLLERHSVGLGTSCGVLDATCSVEDCANGGRCSDMWTGLCDCRGTMHTGSLCTERSGSATFRSNFYVDVDLGHTVPLTDIFLRLKTSGQSSEPTEVLAVADSSGKAGVWVYLSSGQVFVEIIASGGQRVSMASKDAVQDDQYHSVDVDITSTGAQLTVDNGQPMMSTIGSGSMPALVMQRTQLGRFLGPLLTTTQISSVPFDGWMADVVLNEDIRPLDLHAQSSTLDSLIRHNLSATFHVDASVIMNERPVVSNAISFNDSTEGFYLPYQWLFQKKGHLTLHFKTLQENCVIAYQQGDRVSQRTSGAELNHVALIVRNGRLIFSYHNADDVIEALSRGMVSDGLWHQVIARRSAQNITFIVDSSEEALIIQHHADNLAFPKEEHLLIGAVPPGISVSGVNEGFIGCLRHFYASGREVPVMLRELSENITDIVPYCPACEPTNPCGTSARCIEGPEENESYECEAIPTTAPPVTSTAFASTSDEISPEVFTTKADTTEIMPSSSSSSNVSVTVQAEASNTSPAISKPTETTVDDGLTLSSDVSPSIDTNYTDMENTSIPTDVEQDMENETMVETSSTLLGPSTATVVETGSSALPTVVLSTESTLLPPPSIMSQEESIYSTPVISAVSAPLSFIASSIATSSYLTDVPPSMSTMPSSPFISLTVAPSHPLQSSSSELSMEQTSQLLSTPFVSIPYVSSTSLSMEVLSSTFPSATDDMEDETESISTSAMQPLTEVLSSTQLIVPASSPEPEATSFSLVVTSKSALTSDRPTSSQSLTMTVTSESIVTSPTAVLATSDLPTVSESQTRQSMTLTTSIQPTAPVETTVEVATEGSKPVSDGISPTAVLPATTTDSGAETTMESTPISKTTDPSIAALPLLEFSDADAFVDLPALPLSADKPVSLQFSTKEAGIVLFAPGATGRSDFAGLAILAERVVWQFSVNGYVYTVNVQSPPGESYYTDGSWYDVDIVHGDDSVSVSSGGASNMITGTMLKPRLASSAQLGASSGKPVANISDGFVGRVRAVQLGDEDVNLESVAANAQGVKYVNPEMTSTSPAPTPGDEDDSGGLTGGQIAGIVIGCLMIGFLLLLIAFFIVFQVMGRKRGMHRLHESPEYPMTATYSYI